MEAVREIYWNVGRGVTGPMYFFAFIAVSAFLYGHYRRPAIYKLGKPLSGPSILETPPETLISGP